MKLSELLNNLTYTCMQGDSDCEITQVQYDSRKITKDCLFVCIKGAKMDGHLFVEEAVRLGARAVVVSREMKELQNQDITVIYVEDTRYALALISANYFQHPAEKLKVIGITGTKGKTTTAYLVKAILENAGYRVGLIGTIEVVIGERHIPANNTTPESYCLQEYFSQMVQEGIEMVVMEVSSQALKLHRTQGFLFDIGVFTNLSPDHIGTDEHESFEEYRYCKSLLFQQCRLGIVNRDDGNVEEIIKNHTCELETFSIQKESMLQATDISLVHKPGELGVSFQVNGLLSFQVEVPTPGYFSVYNALCAIAICRHFQVSPKQIQGIR